MWIEWNNELINLDLVIRVYVSEIENDQWVVMMDLIEGECVSKLFESEKDAQLEYQRLRCLLIDEGDDWMNLRPASDVLEQFGLKVAR